MPTLLEIQREMGASLMRSIDAAADAVVDNGIPAQARLAIYRNTFAANLVGALRISYPAIQRLVGQEFFEGAARAFIADHPPRSAYLNAYGAEFGDFLTDFPPAKSLAYLPDVARLEWAVNIALNAEDAEPLSPACLASLTAVDVAFIVHPSVALLRVSWPADQIWRAVIDGNDDALATIDMSAGPAFLIVGRTEGSVAVETTNPFAWEFTARLCSGVPLSQVLENTQGDMSAVLAAHLVAGRFTDVQPYPHDERNGP